MRETWTCRNCQRTVTMVMTDSRGVLCWQCHEIEQLERMVLEAPRRLLVLYREIGRVVDGT